MHIIYCFILVLEGELQEEEYQEPDDYEEYEGEEEDAVSILTVYDPDDYISGAVISPQSTIPPNIFEFEYPFLASEIEKYLIP